MPRGNYTIQRSCEECGKIFTPPTLMSKYCCPTCSKRAYKKRQIAKEKEAIRQALVRRIPSSKGYLTVKESVLIYGISKDVLYRMIRQGLIPSYNFGQRLTRLSRQYMDEHFKTKDGSRKRKKDALSFEPKDCYTIGEIAKKFHINDSSVFNAVILFLHAKSVIMFMFPNLKLINYISRYEESITPYQSDRQAQKVELQRRVVSDYRVVPGLQARF